MLVLLTFVFVQVHSTVEPRHLPTLHAVHATCVQQTFRLCIQLSSVVCCPPLILSRFTPLFSAAISARLMLRLLVMSARDSPLRTCSGSSRSSGVMQDCQPMVMSLTAELLLALHHCSLRVGGCCKQQQLIKQAVCLHWQLQPSTAEAVYSGVFCRMVCPSLVSSCSASIHTGAVHCCRPRTGFDAVYCADDLQDPSHSQRL